MVFPEYFAAAVQDAHHTEGAAVEPHAIPHRGAGGVEALGHVRSQHHHIGGVVVVPLAEEAPFGDVIAAYLGVLGGGAHQRHRGQLLAVGEDVHVLLRHGGHGAQLRHLLAQAVHEVDGELAPVSVLPPVSPHHPGKLGDVHGVGAQLRQLPGEGHIQALDDADDGQQRAHPDADAQRRQQRPEPVRTQAVEGDFSAFQEVHAEAHDVSFPRRGRFPASLEDSPADKR